MTDSISQMKKLRLMAVSELLSRSLAVQRSRTTKGGGEKKGEVRETEGRESSTEDKSRSLSVELLL